jgi:myo-inositol 2-dehydrogenase/D-chiro-inositol 1-dehydrogenase
MVATGNAQGYRVSTQRYSSPASSDNDIQCQVVGETGTANLPEPAGVPFRSGGRASTEIILDATTLLDNQDIPLQMGHGYT